MFLEENAEKYLPQQIGRQISSDAHKKSHKKDKIHKSDFIKIKNFYLPHIEKPLSSTLERSFPSPFCA